MYVLAHVGIAIGSLLVLAYAFGRDESLFDVRLLVLGAMLPDLVDKPLNILGVSAGRGYAHSALFLVVLLALCAHYNLPELSFGAATHVLLDTMWNTPTVLFWPLRGLALPSTHYDVAFYWERVVDNGYVQATEGIGAAILVMVVIFYRLYTRDALATFIVRGRVLRAMPHAAEVKKYTGE